MADHQGEARGRVPERNESRDRLPNPNTLFENHLKILEYSYLGFFQERVKIEEDYIASLVHLHQKTRNVDAQVEPNAQNSTVRQAWRELRDNLDREAESRTAFVAAMRADILGPLYHLRDAQDRTRKRVVEDIKESTQSHLDYLENTLPRLKRTYFKKIQEVDEYKSLDRTNLQQSQSQQSLAVSPTEGNFNGFPDPGSVASPPRPSLSSPQPTYPVQNMTSNTTRPSPQPPSQRNRSPSTSTSFSDLAHHGKKALLGLLQEGGNRGGPISNVKDALGDRSNMALRGVRVKREAEEADKEYRKGVHWLETLRLRRLNILRSGYTSLNDFIWEVNKAVKSAMEKYVDCQTGTASTAAQLASHIQRSLNKIDLGKDADLQTYSVTRLDELAKRYLPPVLYQNFLVGECKDLIFGSTLVDYALAKGITSGPGVALGLAGGERPQGKESHKAESVRTDYKSEAIVPRLVRLCVREVDARGLRCEGIYRVSGRHANVIELRHRVERDEALFEFNHKTDDVYCVSSLLKMYLRELPEPVFRFPIQERIQYTTEREDQVAHNFPILRSKMRRLPPVHLATLRLLIEHLARVAANTPINKMDPKNLSIVFGTPIFGEDELPKGADVLTMSTWKDSVMEDMINYASVLFDERPQNSPPLPQIPVGEEPAAVDRDSVHTKVHNPSSPQPPPPSTLQKPGERDFSPLLPPRPDYSIHPGSRRAGHASTSSLGTASNPNSRPGTPDHPLPPVPRTDSPSRQSRTGYEASVHSSPGPRDRVARDPRSSSADTRSNRTSRQFEDTELLLQSMLESQGMTMSDIHTGRTPEGTEDTPKDTLPLRSNSNNRASLSVDGHIPATRRTPPNAGT